MSDHTQVREALHRRFTHHLNALDRGNLHQEALTDLQTGVFQALGVEAEAYDELARDVLYDVIGFGPLLPLMKDPLITEVMVNGPDKVFVEREGRHHQVNVHFDSDQHLRYTVRRLLHLSPGKRLDESSPMVDLSLPDGSRVNIVTPPAAIGGPQITIRKWVRSLTTLEDLVEKGTVDAKIANFLAAAVFARQTVLISGAAGAGKSTLAEVLGHSIQHDDRLVVIEDTYELKFEQPNQVRLLTRAANVEGTGAITMRQLFTNSLRMRPNRIILGEIRGGEAFEFLQAANSGHRGSIGVIHASTPVEALVRLENLGSQSGLDIPLAVLRKQVAHGIDLVVQIERCVDGVRRVTAVSEVQGLSNGEIVVEDLFRYVAKGLHEGRLLGAFEPTGVTPRMLSALLLAGAKIQANTFTPD